MAIYTKGVSRFEGVFIVFIVLSEALCSSGMTYLKDFARSLFIAPKRRPAGAIQLNECQLELRPHDLRSRLRSINMPKKWYDGRVSLHIRGW